MSSDDFLSTQHLVRGAQDGDRTALEELFERYLPRVRRIVAVRMSRRLKELVELEEVVQDALLKVFQGLERFEAQSEGAFCHWVARCVECEVVDHARRSRAQKRIREKPGLLHAVNEGTPLSTLFASDTPTPSEIARASELEERIENALLALPDHYREVIVLRKLCGMDYSEIARAMGFTEELSARKALSRALAKLQKEIGA